MDFPWKRSIFWLLLLIQLVTTTTAELRGEDNSVFPWVVVVLVLVVIGLLTVLIVEVVIVYKVVGLGGVPWRSVWLGQLLLLAITICYLTLIVFVYKPTRVTCNTLRFSLSFSYVFIQSVLFVKILLVLSPKTHAGFLKLGHQVFILTLLCSVQVIINIQWLVLQDSTVETVTNDVRRCTPLRLSTFYYDLLASFTYIFLVGLVLFAVTLTAYSKSRKANGKPNGEARWILVTAFVTTAVWLVWTVVGGVLPFPEAGMAAMAAGLWTTATSTLLIMFVPKLHKLATLKEGELYYEDDLPGLVGYDQSPGEALEMDSRVRQSGPLSERSYQTAESVLFSPSDVTGRGTLLTTLDRPPSVILEEKGCDSVSSIGPSPSLIYKPEDSEKGILTANPHALELRHRTSQPFNPSKYNHYPSLSEEETDFSDFAPPEQRYYTIGGYGRRGPSHRVIDAPRYEKRYVPVLNHDLHHNSHSLEPHYVREVITPHQHHTISTGYSRYGGSSSADSQRYAGSYAGGYAGSYAGGYAGGSSSGSGLDSPAGYQSATYSGTGRSAGRSASAIGIPRYEGPAAKKNFNGYINHSFTLGTPKGSLHRDPVQYVQVSAPRKASSLAGVPAYKPKLLRPLDVGDNSLTAGRRITLSQQDLRSSGLTYMPPHAVRNNVTLMTLPPATKLIYKPLPNGRPMPVEQRQRAFRDDILERRSVY